MAMCEEDKWGNTWMDDAVPGGQEIAEVMLEIRRKHGWREMWAEYDGLRICPRVRVWLDGYQDLDYHEAYLLRVWTESDKYQTTAETDYYGVPSVRTLTITDHLFVYVRHGKPTVEWRQDPRLFFDADSEWLFDGIRKWVDFVQGEVEYRDKDSAAAVSTRDRIYEHNQSVTQRDRDQAIKMGLGPALPYLKVLP